MYKYIIGGVVGLFMLVIVISMLPFTIIGAGERGVVTKFGQVQDQILNEGFHVLTPFQDSVKKVSVRVQKAEIQSSAASKDLQTVNIKVAVNYHLRADRVNKVYQEVGTTEEVVDRVLNPNVSEVVKASTAQRTAEGLLTQRAALKADIDTGLSDRMKSYYVIIDDVSITDIDFSPEFNVAIEEKAKAQQQALKAEQDLARINFESKQRINIASAEAESTRLKAIAEAESIRIKGDALRDNPALVDLEAVKRWNGALPVQMYGAAPVPFINIK